MPDDEPKFDYPWGAGGFLEPCEPCEGVGEVKVEWPDGKPDARTCSKCRGSGVVPNDQGRDIISLITWAKIFGA